MTCTQATRPSTTYLVSLAVIIAILAIILTAGYYLLDTRGELRTLQHAVRQNYMKIAAIPEIVYNLDTDIETAASAEPAPIMAAPYVYHDVLVDVCISRSTSGTAAATVSSSLAHLVGKEVYIPELNLNSYIVNISVYDSLHPAISMCLDPKKARIAEKHPVTLLVK